MYTRTGLFPGMVCTKMCSPREPHSAGGGFILTLPGGACSRLEATRIVSDYLKLPLNFLASISCVGILMHPKKCRSALVGKLASFHEAASYIRLTRNPALAFLGR